MQILAWTGFGSSCWATLSIAPCQICPAHALFCLNAGYGLDWIWPFLLGYPQDRIAVIDEVCVIHPHKPLQERGKVSMYDVNPTFKGWELEEEKDQFAKFGYSAKVTCSLQTAGHGDCCYMTVSIDQQCCSA